MSITQRYAWKLWCIFQSLNTSDEFSSVKSPDLQSLKAARYDNTENPVIGYLNISSLWNKIIDLREVLKHISLDYFVFSETKLDNNFPCAQFQISDYEIRASRDRNKNGGGLIKLVKKGLICKRLKTFEIVNSDCICSELTISNKKCVCFSVSHRYVTETGLSDFHKMICTFF